MKSFFFETPNGHPQVTTAVEFLQLFILWWGQRADKVSDGFGFKRKTLQNHRFLVYLSFYIFLPIGFLGTLFV